MIAKESGRTLLVMISGLALVGPVSTFGQSPRQAAGRGQAQPPAAAPASAPKADQTVPQFVVKPLPVNPTDPICIVNDEVITREQLAHECIARKGEEILETLIARTLIEQALKAKKLEVSAAEIDAEIDSVARKVAGLGREAWLRTLDKERGISPVQYARDIIYPSIALRKLAAPSVQVTQQDMTKSFEAQYGDKLRVRMIMVDKVTAAREIWEELRKNPGGFEKLAMDRSMDTGSRSIGGLLAEPISRHAFPETVSSAAFYQLVDGDTKDRDPSHKPKDGDFTGPIQVAENTWVLLRRESVVPAQKVDPKNEEVKKGVYDMIYEVKLKEAMNGLMQQLLTSASVDNKLTGHIKLADQSPSDPNVQLMGGKAPTGQASPKPGGAGSRPVTTSPNTGKTPTPAGLSPEVVKQADSLPPLKKKSQTQPQPQPQP